MSNMSYNFIIFSVLFVWTWLNMICILKKKDICSVSFLLPFIKSILGEIITSHYGKNRNSTNVITWFINEKLYCLPGFNFQKFSCRTFNDNTIMERGRRNFARNNRITKEPPLIIKPPKKPDHEYKRRGLLGEVCK